MNDDQKSKNNAITTWHTGSEIIREIIKKRRETVPLILQELINKIIAGGVTTTHYIGKKPIILLQNYIKLILFFYPS